MLLLRTLLILGVNAEKLCDRINRAHCVVETMIQATYSFVEEGIIWGHVWPWRCYVNTPGINLVLNQSVHLARNYVYFWLCVSGHRPGWSWCGLQCTKALKDLALEIFTVVCWETELFSCNETVRTVTSLPVKGLNLSKAPVMNSVWLLCNTSLVWLKMNCLGSPVYPWLGCTLVPTDEVLDGIVRIGVFLPQCLRAFKSSWWRQAAGHLRKSPKKTKH